MTLSGLFSRHFFSNQPVQAVALASLMLAILAGLSACTAQVRTGAATAPASPMSQGSSVTRTAAENIQAKPEWFACADTRDCVVTPGVCGEARAVGRRFLAPFQAYAKRMDVSLSCVVPTASGKFPAARCVKKRCALNDK